MKKCCVFSLDYPITGYVQLIIDAGIIQAFSGEKKIPSMTIARLMPFFTS